MKTAIIIGGGAAGCAAAHQLSRMGGWDITLIEAADHLGAGVLTRTYGGHPYTMGPRHFLTQNGKVFDYMNDCIRMRNCGEHQFLTYVEQDHNFYNYPIHEDDIPRMPEARQIRAELEAPRQANMPRNFEEYWMKAVGPTLYNKFVRTYNEKMWTGLKNIYIDTFNWSPKGVALKSGPRAAWDTAISAYPKAPDGYNQWFKIATRDVKVKLSTKILAFDLQKNELWTHDDRLKADIIISTISPDIPFNWFFGGLPYIGRDFTKIVLPVEFALPKDVYFIYEAGEESWTRITEMKKFTQHKSDQTLLIMETPSRNGNFYPLPLKSEQRKAQQYYDLMGPGVYCMGRNGSYRYSIDIAACIEQAFGLVERLEQGGGGHPVIGKWSEI